VAILITMGCSDSPALTPLEGGATVLAFGDSLTLGVGANKGSDYPSQLASLTGLSVINAGISGETTAQGVQRFAAELDKHQPKLVILLEGGNDILRGVSYATIESNLQRMLDMAQARGIQVLLVAVPEKKLFSDYAPFYATLAERNNLVWLDDTLGDLLRDPTLKADPIHLNARGYRKLAEIIAATLAESGAL